MKKWFKGLITRASNILYRKKVITELQQETKLPSTKLSMKMTKCILFTVQEINSKIK